MRDLLDKIKLFEDDDSLEGWKDQYNKGYIDHTEQDWELHIDTSITGDVVAYLKRTGQEDPVDQEKIAYFDYDYIVEILTDLIEDNWVKSFTTFIDGKPHDGGAEGDIEAAAAVLAHG